MRQRETGTDKSHSSGSGGLDRSPGVAKHNPMAGRSSTPPRHNRYDTSKNTCTQTNKAQVNPRPNGQRTHFHMADKIYLLIVIELGYTSTDPICLTGIRQNKKRLTAYPHAFHQVSISSSRCMVRSCYLFVPGWHVCVAVKDAVCGPLAQFTSWLARYDPSFCPCCGDWGSNLCPSSAPKLTKTCLPTRYRPSTAIDWTPSVTCLLLATLSCIKNKNRNMPFIVLRQNHQKYNRLQSCDHYLNADCIYMYLNS